MCRHIYDWNIVNCDVKQPIYLPYYGFNFVYFIIFNKKQFAYKIRISDSPLCTFCDSEEETIVHVLWECNNVQRFLHRIETWLQSYDFQFQFEKQSFLLVNSMERNESNLIMSLSIKFFIYKTKCLKETLSLTKLQYHLKSVYEIHKYKYRKEQKSENLLKYGKIGKPSLNNSVYTVFSFQPHYIINF